jgi:hypothetical protein
MTTGLNAAGWEEFHAMGPFNAKVEQGREFYI